MTDFVVSTARRQRWTVLHRLLQRPAAVVGLAVIGLLICVAALAPVIAPYSPTQIDVQHLFSGPSAAHWLGTDYVGRDQLSRVIYGSRTALRIGFPAVAIGFVPGLLMGLFAGYIGGLVDGIAIVVMDAILSLPAVIFALVVITLFGNSITVITFIIAIAFIPGYGRLARAQTLAVKENVYVKAERSLGASPTRIILHHILPNIVPPLLVLMAMDVPGAIGAEAGLAFLGIGVQPPTADWGVSLNQGFIYVRTQPWGLAGPLVALLLVTGAFVVLGETLRDVLDPRLASADVARRLRLRGGIQRL